MKEDNEKIKKFTDASADADQEFTSIDHYLKSIRVEQPSVNFTKKVMNNLHRTATITLNLPSRKNMLILAGVLVAIGITILLVAGGAFESVTAITVDQKLIPNEKIRERIPSIPFDGKLVFNIVILMNLALVFIILDRAVLKPWFTKRARINY